VNLENAGRDPSESTLRVLFVSREYPPETGGGGIGSYVESMARALVLRGHEVHVLSCVPGQATDDRVHGGVQLHRRGVHRLLPKIRRRIPSTALRIEGAISCYLEFLRLGVAVDVVEAPDWLAEGWAFAVLGSRPLVAHLHTPLFLVGRTNPRSFRWTRDGHGADLVERLAVRRADLLTSPSELLVRDLAREGWIGDREARIVRYPVDLEAWASLPPVGSSPPRVLAVGRLEARKAPEVLVRAAAALAGEVPQLEVVFVGRSGLRNGGSYREWLIGLADELGAPCRFVDQVPRHELRRWYGDSRVVALCSRYDNFPFAGLEAMAASRPVVCTSATGTAEIIAGTHAGAVVAVDDVDGIAAALRPYLVDAAAAEQAGREAYSVVGKHCSPERIAEQREDCYREAIQRWRRRPRGRLRIWRS
jgi:glycosyltransferase involved in cell wall biosynthesis